MKKIFFISVIILVIFIIYLCTSDKKIYYLALGDSLALGQTPYGEVGNGYSFYVSDYLNKKGKLETLINNFASSGKKAPDIINDINGNKELNINKKKYTLKNSLIKADLVTISLDNREIIEKLKNQTIDYNYIYKYIDDLTKDLDKLLNLIRKYCKEDIMYIGYYNPLSYSKNSNTEKIIKYLNKKYKQTCNKYNVDYISIYNVFKNNNYLPEKNSIYPNNTGYKEISNQIIKKIRQKTLKT